MVQQQMRAALAARVGKDELGPPAAVCSRYAPVGRPAAQAGLVLLLLLPLLLGRRQRAVLAWPLAGAAAAATAAVWRTLLLRAAAVAAAADSRGLRVWPGVGQAAAVVRSRRPGQEAGCLQRRRAGARPRLLRAYAWRAAAHRNHTHQPNQLPSKRMCTPPVSPSRTCSCAR